MKLIDITEKLTEDKTTSLVIADFGTSDGGNILPFLRKIIGKVSF